MKDGCGALPLDDRKQRPLREWWQDAIECRVERIPLLEDLHDADDLPQVFTKSGITNVLSQPLKVLVPSLPRCHRWILSPQFCKHSRSKAVVNQVIREVPEVLW